MSRPNQHDKAMRNKVNLKMLLELQSCPPPPPSFLKQEERAGEVSELSPGRDEEPEQVGELKQLSISGGFGFFFLCDSELDGCRAGRGQER